MIEFHFTFKYWWTLAQRDWKWNLLKWEKKILLHFIFLQGSWKIVVSWQFWTFVVWTTRFVCLSVLSIFFWPKGPPYSLTVIRLICCTCNVSGLHTVVTLSHRKLHIFLQSNFINRPTSPSTTYMTLIFSKPYLSDWSNWSINQYFSCRQRSNCIESL